MTAPNVNSVEAFEVDVLESSEKFTRFALRWRSGRTAITVSPGSTLPTSKFLLFRAMIESANGVFRDVRSID